MTILESILLGGCQDIRIGRQVRNGDLIRCITFPNKGEAVRAISIGIILFGELIILSAHGAAAVHSAAIELQVKDLTAIGIIHFAIMIINL